MKFSWTSLVLIVGTLFANNLLVNAECCQKKEVKGDDAKAGFYYLVRDSKDVPDFCIDGCVYTKEDDERPGTYYCFKSGGQMDSKCSMSDGGGCSGIEGWIDKYFQKECKMPVNAVLEVSNAVDLKYDCYGLDQCQTALPNTSIKLFKGNKNCTGEPTAQSFTKMPTSRCGNSSTNFFLTITELEDWSIAFEREGFRSGCSSLNVEPMKTDIIMTKQKQLRFQKIPSMLLNFEFEANSVLLPDVKVLKTDLFLCRNVTGITPGTPSWCSSSCTTASYITDEIDLDCNCKGVLGGDLKFSELHYPNENNQRGLAKMEGNIMWYGEWTGRNYLDLSLNKAFLVYSHFLRRSGNDQVCASKLNITLKSQEGSSDPIMKSVPCIPPQIPESTFTMPSNNIFQSTTEAQSNTETGSPDVVDAPLTIGQEQKDEIMGMFTEIDGSLVFGGGDMFWMAGCQALANVANFISFPNFFTSQDPIETPALCGCLLIVTNGIPESREFTVDQVKECYVEALIAGRPGEQRDPRTVDMESTNQYYDAKEMFGFQLQ